MGRQDNRQRPGNRRPVVFLVAGPAFNSQPLLGASAAASSKETQSFGCFGRYFSEATLLLTRRFKEVLMTMWRNPR